MVLIFPTTPLVTASPVYQMSIVLPHRVFRGWGAKVLPLLRFGHKPHAYLNSGSAQSHFGYSQAGNPCNHSSENDYMETNGKEA